MLKQLSGFYFVQISSEGEYVNVRVTYAESEKVGVKGIVNKNYNKKDFERIANNWIAKK
jgi:hypothetical protein